MCSYNLLLMSDRLFSTIIETMEQLNNTVQKCSRGFGDIDVEDIRLYLSRQLPAILNAYRKQTKIAPTPISDKYSDQTIALEEWDRILRKMICHFREMSGETCSQKNPYAKRFYELKPLLRTRTPKSDRILQQYYEYEEKLQRYRQWNMQKGFWLLEEYGQYLFL